MGDAKKLGCCGKLFIAGLLGVIALCGWAVYVHSAVHADAPLDFRAFRYQPLERTTLTAKFELNELPSRLLTGGPVEVQLGERELNALFFGEANHREDGEKARILVEGDRLVVETTKPLENGKHLNIRARFRLAFGPESSLVTLLEGTVGSYALGPVSRPIVQRLLQDGLTEARARDEHLARIEALSVAEDRVKVIYHPK